MATKVINELVAPLWSLEKFIRNTYVFITVLVVVVIITVFLSRVSAALLPPP